jgi:hypothetical protein
MAVFILQARPFVRMAAPTARTVCARFLGVLDSVAAAQLRNAVPPRLLKQRRTASRSRGPRRERAPLLGD